ncbi:MAG TPA: UrcA family protein [Caulobacteraceae bacterium]|nr:UrcA family protein [Caulobacteraceae bacterium]
MNRYVNSAAMAATWALAAMPILALASAAHAEGVTIRYGDLNQPAQAAAFERRVEAAAHSFCDTRYRPIEASQKAACMQAVRDEAQSKLAPAERARMASL